MRRVRQFAMVLVVLAFIVICFTKNSFSYSLLDDEKSSRGPITIKNQMPLYLFYLQMSPDKADVVKSHRFKTNIDYTVSNVTVSAFTPASSLYITDIDLEVSRLNLDLRYGIYDDLEIGLEIPYISMSSGYLDNFIESFEDAIGARTPRSREKQGSYEFDYALRYNWGYLINKKGSIEGIGDMSFNVKYQLLKDSGYFVPNLALRSALKFPTADKNDLLGSGEFDYGFGLLIDKMFFERFFLYLGGNIVLIEKPSFLDALDIDSKMYSLLAGLEYFFTDRFSVVLQASGNTTVYPYSDTNPLDNDAFDIGLGFNYAFKGKENMSWHFAITENYSAASTPDVAFHAGISYEF
ncbi:MAG: DUF3187 family protein [Candidatus Omnitrophota bacterium]